ncbi:MAG: TolC family protein [Elusimicrobia bacterium]|nr:TolC family protein [Elusimicrobiota bacterium]
MRPPNLVPKPGWIPIDPFWQLRTKSVFISRDGSDGKLMIRYFRTAAGDSLKALVWFGPATEGPPGHAHGGSVAAVLDEVLGAAAWARGLVVMTAKITVKFRRVVPLGTVATVEARVRRAGQSRVVVAGELADGRGRTCAEAEGVFVKVLKASWGVRFLALCFLLGSGLAEAAQIKPDLRWEDCVGLALRHNPDLAAARLSHEAARAGYKGAFSSLMPSLSLSNGVSDSDTSAKQSWQAQGSLGLDLFNMGNYAFIRSNSAALRQTEAALRLKSADLRASLAKAFAQLLYAQDAVGVADRIQAVRQANADLVSLKYDSGRESRGNMLRAKADLSAAKADALAARRDVRTARIALNRLLGMDDYAVVSATGTWALPVVPPEPGPQPLRGHPRLASLQASVDSSKADVASAFSSLWPTVSAGYSRSWQDTDYFPDRPHWSAGGTLSYKLFSGGPTAVYYAASKSKKNLEKADENLRSGTSALRSTLESAWAALASAASDVAVGAESLEAARQRNDEASVRYATGLMNFENWEAVVTEFVQSEKYYVRVIRDAVSAMADWDNALGRPLEGP